MEDNAVKIYMLLHPISGEIRYVGKTVESLEVRLSRHIRSKEKTYKCNWIKSLINDRLVPKIELIEECKIDDWRWVEKYWISQFLTWGFNLTNMCEGGLGSDGLKHSQESIEKIRMASIGNKNRVGKTFSKESIEKIRLGNLNKKIKQESIDRMIETKRGKSYGVGRKHSEIHINNITNSVISVKGKPVLQFDLNMNLIKEWESISTASKSLKIPNSNIVNVCKGNRNTAKNFNWKYK